jgi:Ion channel
VSASPEARPEAQAGPGRRHPVARFLWGTPCATLLAVQLLGVVLYPELEDASGRVGGLSRAVLGLFGIVVLFLAVVAVRRTPALTWISGVLGLPLVVLTVVEAFNPDNQTVIVWSGLLHALFYFYTAYGLVRYMFNDDDVTTDELFATGAAFTVLAWAFAYLYSAVQTLWPQSFVAYNDPEAPRSWFELLYLSFTTLTSTGLSDVTPVLPHARSAVMIEQVLGLMYVAFIVARLVGLQIRSIRRG